MRRAILVFLVFIVLLSISSAHNKELKIYDKNLFGCVSDVYLIDINSDKSIYGIENVYSFRKISLMVENGSLIKMDELYMSILAGQFEFESNETSMERLRSTEKFVLSFLRNYEEVKDFNRLDEKIFYEEKLSDSLLNIELKITYVGKYDLERQEFPVTINNETRLIKIPLSEAKEFKDNWENAKVLAQKVIKNGQELNELFNIRIIHPVTGTVYYFGEQKDLSKMFDLDKKISESKELLIPKLKLDVSFKDTDGNEFLDAGENGKIIIKVRNDGLSDSKNFKIIIENQSQITDLFYQSTLNCGTIKSNSEQTFEIDIKAPINVSNSVVNFLITGVEANGFNPEPVKLVFNTRSLLLPKFELIDYYITNSSGDNTIRTEEISNINVRIQNRGQGKGQNVRINIQLPQNIFFASSSKRSYEFREIPVSDFVNIEFSIIPFKDVNEEIELKIDVTDANTNVTLPLRLSIDKSKEISQAQIINEEEMVELKDINSFRGELDIDIPETSRKNKIAIGLIISISNYKDTRIPIVKFAKRDALLMRQYLEKTLGYESKNILPQDTNELFTLATMKNYLKFKLPSYLSSDGSSEVFIYFVGHGAPSPKEVGTYYLLPFDVDLDYLSDFNAYNLKEFFEDIKKLNASKKIIVIDASFNGQTGDGIELISNVSPINDKIKNTLILDNNSIFFLSSEVDQLSNWYLEKQNSMFTYFFLKGLKGDADKNGNGVITVGELKSYINDENEGLPYYSNRLFQRKQNAVIVGDEKTPIVVR